MYQGWTPVTEFEISNAAPLVGCMECETFHGADEDCPVCFGENPIEEAYRMSDDYAEWLQFTQDLRQGV